MECSAGNQYLYINGHRMNSPQVQQLTTKLCSHLIQARSKKLQKEAGLAWLLLLECPSSFYSVIRNDSGDAEAHFHEQAVIADVQDYVVSTFNCSVLDMHKSEEEHRQSKHANPQVLSSRSTQFCQATSQAASFASRLSNPAVLPPKLCASKKVVREDRVQKAGTSQARQPGEEVSQRPCKSLQTDQHRDNAAQSKSQHVPIIEQHSPQPSRNDALPFEFASSLQNSRSISKLGAEAFPASAKPGAAQNQQPVLLSQQAEPPLSHPSEGQPAIPLADVLQRWQNPCISFDQPVRLAADVYTVGNTLDVIQIMALYPKRAGSSRDEDCLSAEVRLLLAMFPHIPNHMIYNEIFEIKDHSGSKWSHKEAIARR